MDVKRREFLVGCVAASVLGMPSIASGENAINAPALDPGLNIEKSIKASFGGGFSVRAHTLSAGRTYADIEHSGNRYVVTSADLLDWKIVASSLGNPSFTSPSIGGASISMV